ncbi:MAG: hypothetical protein ACHQUA_00260 [Microgenomates group bacterium]
MEFNPSESKIMLMDINSCFATIEQQANPNLRGKPVVVAAYKTSKGTVLAASVDAKKLGIKTGMRVMDAQVIYPKVVVLSPDPNKYRNVHIKLHKILLEYTDEVEPKSIDEFAMNLDGYPYLQKHSMVDLAHEIKERIKKEVGDYITVSIGISPNRYLAKVAAGFIKPDGLVEINKENYLKIYSSMELTDLTGIKKGNSSRLNGMGIYTVLDFYNAPPWKLKAAFHSVMSHSWYLRLRGYEIDNVPFARRSYGNSVAIGKNLSEIADLSPILARLVDKMSSRFRGSGYRAKGIHLSLAYKNGGYWHKGRATSSEMFDSREIFREALILLKEAKPKHPVRIISVTCFDLKQDTSLQQQLFKDVAKDEDLIKAVDQVNSKWGDFTLGLARSFKGENIVLDRIAFGGGKELEELSKSLN